ncbi:unnamed protein product [Caenorhabditis angaria]|uniref:Dolichyl-diphosphooligosaccharide--protein glycosyltransferase subunit 1 n=1 Tax=Caenorhabditis angaria TaxID=860376 RepID=A0A9P1IKU8_9PELO|nr:unnamed protein product [Caenorhabditis angaria]
MKAFSVLGLISLLGLVSSWKIANLDRSIDIASQVVKVSTLYTFENDGTSAEKQVKIAFSQEEADHLSFIAATIEGNKGKLKISKVAAKNANFVEYAIDLASPITTGHQIKIRVNSRFSHALTPLPAKIQQSESQFVVYQGSAYAPAAYQVATQKTTIKTAQGGKTLSATNIVPTKQETERVIYGPYANIAAFESKEIRVHYENNFPFVVATLVERTIEVSHWGNVAVEEYIELVHQGAELEGSFSRIDYQMDRRGRNQPALQHFTTILPSTARDIYYRDEIGNISTSAVRIRAQSVDVEIRPRFPLFGGWKTSYVIGYNVPTEEFLYNSGNQYALKMKLFDHVFDNIVVDKLVTKVVLPEHVKKVKISTPYAVNRKPDELRPTYLDTIGRLVIVVEKENVVTDHSQFFTVSYEFEFNDLIREPLLASFFFLALFGVVIIYGRFDFTIVEDPEREAEERHQELLEKLANFVEQKQSAYAVLSAGKQHLTNSRNQINNKLGEEVEQVKKLISAAAAEKASELAKYDKNVFDLVDNYLKAVEKSTSKTGGADEQQFVQKIADARARADAILSGI